MSIDTILNPGENLKRNYRKTATKHRKKRQQRRFIERCKVEFTVDGKIYRGLSKDFALNGLFIRTKHTFQSGTLLSIRIRFPNDSTSLLTGKVARVLKNPLWGATETGRGCGENGLGIEIMEKDSLYLHFIRFLLDTGKDLRKLVFSEQESRHRKIKSELQERCRLFDVVAFFIGEQSKQDQLWGKVWFEAKMKNNTNYTFKVPIVIFMTITNTNNHHIQNDQSNSYPEVGVVMISSINDVSWKPDETILFTGEIDISSEDVLDYERAFIDYLAKTFEFVQEEAINIDNYISTLWIASPYLDVDSQFVNTIQHS